MKNFWQKDKKEHYYIALIASFILDFALTIIFSLYNVKDISLADLITIVLGLIAILACEFLPKRVFSVGDMIAGTLGLFTGLVLAKVVLVIGYWIIG